MSEHLPLMRYPWDDALKGGWGHSGHVFMTRKNVANIARGATTIEKRDIYRSVKFPKSRRLRTYIRKLRDSFVGLAYALRT